MTAAVPAGKQEAPRRPRVVIVGAGFAGIEAARGLARAPVDITVIDRENHHCFQPLLYQVATAVLSPAEVAWPVRAILRSQDNVRIVMASVSGVDVERRCVIADAIRVSYDYLVLATGATHSYFGHDEWAPFAPGLKRIEDAVGIRERILLAFERAELLDDHDEQRRQLTFVVIGGGPTGVEMAGALAEVARHAIKGEFRRFNPGSTRIMLLEAGSRILPSFPEDLSDYAAGALARLGVEVRTGAKVTACNDKGVEIGDEGIAAATIVWAAGVAASPAAQWLGAEHDRAGRVKVGADLKVPGHRSIYVVGDTAALPEAVGPVPGIAPAAKQMGRHAARAIAAEIAGRPPPAPFTYRHAGDLATIGRKAAVVSFGRIKLTGFIGWIFWGIAHIYFLIGIRHRLVVAINWLWNFVTFQRGARLITHRPRR